MNKLFGTNDDREEQHPLWLTALAGLAVVAVLTVMLVFLFCTSSL